MSSKQSLLSQQRQIFQPFPSLIDFLQNLKQCYINDIHKQSLYDIRFHIYLFSINYRLIK